MVGVTWSGRCRDASLRRIPHGGDMSACLVSWNTDMCHHQSCREVTIKLSDPLYRNRSIRSTRKHPSRAIIRYRNQRFPHEITAHVLWPYHRYETIHSRARLILVVKLRPGSGQASADYPNYDNNDQRDGRSVATGCCPRATTTV